MWKENRKYFSIQNLYDGKKRNYYYKINKNQLFPQKSRKNVSDAEKQFGIIQGFSSELKTTTFYDPKKWAEKSIQQEDYRYDSPLR